MNFPERLKKLRKENNLSQNALAEEIGFAYQNIQKYENGTAEPLVKNLKILAEIFDVSIDYLVGESNFRSSKQFLKNIELLSDVEQKQVIQLINKLLNQHK